MARAIRSSMKRLSSSPSSTLIRCFYTFPNEDSPMDMVSTMGTWGATRHAQLFPGVDYRHWFVEMDDQPAVEGASKRQIIDCYVKTLAKVVGSEEEAKRKIYKVNCVPVRTRVGFGCELDGEETVFKLTDFPNVVTVVPDTYQDAYNKDYGGELFVNGKIVRRSAERERLVRCVRPGEDEAEDEEAVCDESAI